MTGILNALIAGVSGAVKDTYFNLVSLLLPGNGTNGAQNNTFLDSGTANSGSGFTITRNGNTTQGTFSPFSQTGWGGSFDGSNDYVTVPYSTTDFDWFTAGQDFTLEAWVYPTSLSTWQDAGAAPMLIGNGEPGGNYWSFGPLSNGTVRFFYYNGASVNVTSTATVTANQWNHIAMTKTSSGITIYVNGSGTTATAISGTPQSGTAIPLSIGRAGSSYINGYVSNLRILKNVTPPYSGTSYTVPTAPLTNVSGTKLLTLQSNRFVDNSSSPRTITVYNGTAITPFSPFAPTQSYSAAAVGGSGYFDGTGDYLTPQTSSAFSFDADFTIEFWLNAPSLSASNSVFIVNAGGVYLALNLSTTVAQAYLNTSTAAFTSSATIPLNAWNHVALVRSGSTVTIYVNGSALPTTGSSSATLGSSSSAFVIAGLTGGFSGYLSNFRVVKGTAVYTGNFTPPTGQLATSGAASAASYPSTANVNTSFASSATSLLLNFTNAGITDATAKNVLETVGNAQISTSVSKFGGGSISFDGTGDYLLSNNNYLPVLSASGDMTIEMWLYPTSTSSLQMLVAMAGGGSTSDFYFYISTGGLIGVETGSGYRDSATSIITANTWQHVALTKSGSTYKIYVGGTERTITGAGTMLTTLTNSALYIGAGNTGANLLTGYIDDLRVSNMLRYNGNFTPPSAPFPVQ